MVNNWSQSLIKIEKDVLDGIELEFDQALSLTQIPDEFLPLLFKAANKVREHFTQNKVDLCSIVNARSGKCAENCKFCTQSAHYKTNPPTYPMKSVEEIVKSAKIAEENGAHRFCIVTSGGALSDKDFNIAVEAIKQISKTTNMKRCASLGALSTKRAKELKEAGLSRYHHNIETTESYYSSICTTHDFSERIKTIENVKEAGIQNCVGGILNLGESEKQRIEFAFDLKKIDPVSVPINFLDPRPKTPLADREPISAKEAAKYLAIYRLILPKAYIRLAGGRLQTFFEEQDLPFTSGVNALLIGDLLTTKGKEAGTDIEMLKSLGFNVE